ncbi:hypothetical protein Sjap_016262 [Stephania japonica]|uniref:Drought induced 19 protein type zinc-binding domain-containing protein n=1 Tax=Stephania japonica TaxID=461633 RepID=A0AAP0ILL9_9MAGN
MDVDFWAARVRSTKHINAVQASRLFSGANWVVSLVFMEDLDLGIWVLWCVVWIWDWIWIVSCGICCVDTHLCLDDSEGDDDVRATFPCPFCYVDVEVSLLSTHLQDEHCFDVKNAVCPLCAANLGKDLVGHFTMRHSHMLKRRRKSQRSGFLTKGAAALGSELRELTYFLGVATKIGRENAPDLAPDPLLSPFLPVAPSDAQEPSAVVGEPNQETKSIVSSKSHEAQEQDNQEKSERAEFSQQLIMSTIF